MDDDDPSLEPTGRGHEREYRRAYTNGATEVLYLLAHKLTPEELEMVTIWVERELLTWGTENLEHAVRPPSFPLLKGQRPRRHGMWF